MCVSIDTSALNINATSLGVKPSIEKEKENKIRRIPNSRNENHIFCHLNLLDF
jgi:hypothetical protein